jgi:hypothetical protein
MAPPSAALDIERTLISPPTASSALFGVVTRLLRFAIPGVGPLVARLEVADAEVPICPKMSYKFSFITSGP